MATRLYTELTFKKPTKNTKLLSFNKALIVKTSNAKSSTGCCGSSSNSKNNNTGDKDDILYDVYILESSKTEDQVDMESEDSYRVKVSVANIRKETNIQSDVLCQAVFQNELEFLGSDESNQWYHVKTGSGKEGWIWHENVNNSNFPQAKSLRIRIKREKISNKK